MKIKMSQILLDENEKEISPKGGPAVTLQVVCINSILGVDQKDDQKTKFEKYEIFKKIKKTDKDGFVDLKAEDIVLLKKAIGVFQPVLILGQSFEMLEGETK